MDSTCVIAYGIHVPLISKMVPDGQPLKIPPARFAEDLREFES